MGLVSYLVQGAIDQLNADTEKKLDEYDSTWKPAFDAWFARREAEIARNNTQPQPRKK